MALGAVLIVIGLALALGSGAYGRWTAKLEERNRFWWTPVQGSALVKLRQGFTALVGVAFIVAGVAAIASGA